MHDFMQETLNVADVFHYYCVSSTTFSCCCTAHLIVVSKQ